MISAKDYREIAKTVYSVDPKSKDYKKGQPKSAGKFARKIKSGMSTWWRKTWLAG